MKNFTYVYVLYFYNPYATTNQERWNQPEIVVYSSLRRCMEVISIQEPGKSIETIKKNGIWRAGNYWVERQPVIGSKTEQGIGGLKERMFKLIRKLTLKRILKTTG